MMSQITPKHMLDNQILLKTVKILNSTEINPNSTYPLSEPSVLPPPPPPIKFNLSFIWLMYGCEFSNS